MWQITADTGGTFTDCYALTPTGAALRCKVLSTGHLRAVVTEVLSLTELVVQGLPDVPVDFWAGFTFRLLAGDTTARSVVSWHPETGRLVVDEPLVEVETGALLELASGEEAPILGARLLTATPLGKSFPAMQLRLATTRATNALLERKGSPTAFFVTEGFGDLLAIGDQRRQDLFALKHEGKEVFYAANVDVMERIGTNGELLHPVDETALVKAASPLVAQGIRHAAVALLHGSRYPAHERRVGDILRSVGFEHVSLSSDMAAFPKLLPRAQSAVANAYLTGPVESFMQGITASLQGSEVGFQMMTSAGGLEPADSIRPKDLLLSGPAGGVVGAANAALRAGYSRVLTLDMGGTSTDVARIDGRPAFRFTQQVAGMQLLAPCVAIETVAAGGGSICQWTPQGLAVGPESAGSNPGPACYGKGGPLTITDVNLLSGRFDPQRSPIPLDAAAARKRLEELHDACGRCMTKEELLQGCLRLAVEHMADAIRKISVAQGYDPKDYALLAFGGAGPQHACAVAESLGISTILVPRHAGILSAVGLHEALPERFAEQQVLRSVQECLPEVPELIQVLVRQAQAKLLADGVAAEECGEACVLAEMRLKGQDATLQVAVSSPDELLESYRQQFKRLFGYSPEQDRVVELVHLRVSVGQRPAVPIQQGHLDLDEIPRPEDGLLQDEFSTLVVDSGWRVYEQTGLGFVLERQAQDKLSQPGLSLNLERELVRHRLHAIVEEMGALLQRTAISTNIRERLDFSCALLDARGNLISSAPHIPVHLGALGVCVRESIRGFTLNPGDTIVTNHPAFGGSHLPDVTVITPVFDAQKVLLGFVANRAHHAEIGGMTPGSMPATATCLMEEGVVITPMYLVKGGISHFEQVAEMLRGGPHPTRNLADNLADLHAQLAANNQGAERLLVLATLTTPDRLRELLQLILDHSAQVFRARLDSIQPASAVQCLDDGSKIQVEVSVRDGRLILDFAGTSAVHPRNLNATQAVVRSAVLYVLRLLMQEDLPLNEGLLEPVEIRVPESLLNPRFSGDAATDPAVVGGNVEVSQRLVDTLIEAFDLQACSQGTMNNFLFGGETFGYYETIAGGSGAGDGYAGCNALHTHMTNTAITDPETLEQRYPVRLRQFAIRRGSGGKGRWEGGCGVVRELEFLAPLTVSILSQHRLEGPFGRQGGEAGAVGTQAIKKKENGWSPLPGCSSFAVEAGDRVRIETPGGGGWGAAI